MEATILPDGEKFAVWSGGAVVRGGFESREEAGWWANENGYQLS